jgi:hypothetical protein
MIHKLRDLKTKYNVCVLKDYYKKKNCNFFPKRTDLKRNLFVFERVTNETWV